MNAIRIFERGLLGGLGGGGGFTGFDTDLCKAGGAPFFAATFVTGDLAMGLSFESPRKEGTLVGVSFCGILGVDLCEAGGTLAFGSALAESSLVIISS